jgi:hypothetical protein
LGDDRNDASAFAWLVGLEILEVLSQIGCLSSNVETAVRLHTGDVA